jgi:hypothetical protein
MMVEQRRRDPFLRFLDAAPPDDEPETEEERAAIAEVEADQARPASRPSRSTRSSVRTEALEQSAR